MSQEMISPILKPMFGDMLGPIMGGGGGPTPPTPTYATWSPTDKNAAITVGGGDLVATLVDLNNTWTSLRANIGKSAGSGYFEVQFPATTDGLQFVGLANASATLASATFIGYDNNGAGYFGDGVIYRNLTDIALPPSYRTEYMGVEVNFATTTARFYKGNTLAATISIATLTGPIFPAGSLYLVGRTAVINCGQTPFFRTPTSGITPYWSADA